MTVCRLQMTEERKMADYSLQITVEEKRQITDCRLQMTVSKTDDSLQMSGKTQSLFLVL